MVWRWTRKSRNEPPPVRIEWQYTSHMATGTCRLHVSSSRQDNLTTTDFNEGTWICALHRNDLQRNIAQPYSSRAFSRLVPGIPCWPSFSELSNISPCCLISFSKILFTSSWPLKKKINFNEVLFLCNKMHSF